LGFGIPSSFVIGGAFVIPAQRAGFGLPAGIFWDIIGPVRATAFTDEASG
jgi:hypothetical protein